MYFFIVFVSGQNAWIFTVPMKIGLFFLSLGNVWCYFTCKEKSIINHLRKELPAIFWSINQPIN